MRTHTNRAIAARGATVAFILNAIAMAPGAAQIPQRFTNLQVLPGDISRDSLTAVMRSFSMATGYGCGDCHVMGPNNSFQGARFDSDEKLAKQQARYMMQLVSTINDEKMPYMPGRALDGMKVECKTCHRGIAKPYLLRTELRHIIDTEGADSAAARYRQLRAERAMDGIYDFREQEMNELARELEAAGKDAEAAAMLEVNAEAHPESAAIPRTLGPIYERLGRRDAALAAYRRAVQLNPNDARSAERIRALGGG